MINFKRRGMAAALAVVLLVSPITGAQTPARDTSRFVGTWRLVSETTTGMNRKANINPGQVGDDVVRTYVFETNDRLVLTPAGSTNKIVWERAR